MLVELRLPVGEGLREDVGDMLCGLLEPNCAFATLCTWLLVCCCVLACIAAAAAAAAGTDAGVG